MKHDEDALQAAVAQYLDMLGVLWFHTPNGGYRRRLEAMRLKRAGVKAGVPDVIIITDRDLFRGIAIELKVGKNKPTPEQLRWLDGMQDRGWRIAVCRSLDEVINVLASAGIGI